MPELKDFPKTVGFDENDEPIFELTKKKESVELDEALEVTPFLIPKPDRIPKKDYVNPNDPDDTTFGGSPVELDRMMREAEKQKRKTLKDVVGNKDEPFNFDEPDKKHGK